MVKRRITFVLPLVAVPVLALTFLGLFPVHADAQDQAAPPPPDATSTLSVNVRLVSIDAVVRDKEGNPVLNLGQDAFTLQSDRKPVPIRYFNRDQNLPLTVGLMIDTSESQRDFLEDEGLASEIFLRNTLTNPQDRAFVVRFASQVVMLQKMTSKLGELHNALRLLDYQRDPLAGTSRSGTLLFDAIGTVSPTAFGTDPGRRALVILTDGGDNGSRMDLSAAIRQAQLANLAIYGVLYTSEDVNYPHIPNERPSGIAIMRQLSQATGGRSFIVGAGTPIAQIFAAIAQDLRSQYRFGFTPPPSKPGKFHSLQLKAVDKGLTVQARNGYYTPPAPESQ